MAFDAGMVMAVAHELKNELLSSKVEKVLQPEKDEIILLLHKGRETKRLLLSTRRITLPHGHTAMKRV